MGHAISVVVVGQGYVGLPLAMRACSVGLDVVGVDTDPTTVSSLNSGRSHIDDVPDGAVADALQLGYRVTTDATVLSAADVVVVCVPTPLDHQGSPDLGAIEAAADELGRHVQPGTLCVLESTSYPGTTEEVFAPRITAGGLKVGLDVFIAFSPERIDPGNPTYGLVNTPKIVGGVTEACRDRAEAFYRLLIDEVVLARGPREAELAKVLENTFRYINIALVNEMVRFCRELNIDLWDAIECAATKPFGFMPFKPGPGVGGHCIPVDPRYLSHRVQAKLGYPFQLLQVAEAVNATAPEYVAERVRMILYRQGLAISKSRVLLVGVTYKPDVSDCRESPAIAVAQTLRALGATLSYHDPYVPLWPQGAGHLQPALATVQNVYDAASGSDVVVLLQNHRFYDLDLLASKSAQILDTRGCLMGDTVERL